MAIYPKRNSPFDPFREKGVSFLFFISKTMPITPLMGVIRGPKEMGIMVFYWPQYTEKQLFFGVLGPIKRHDPHFFGPPYDPHKGGHGHGF